MSPEGSAGHSPPTPHRPAVSVSEEQQRFSRMHNPEAIAQAKGAGTGGKSNLAGQIIPIYGFGILLYILYILFKITSKGKTTKPPESRFAAVRSENMKRKITDFELAQLQDRLNETKDVIERIISAASAGSDRSVAVDEEQKLLHQLQEITRIMQEGRFVDTIPADAHGSDHFCCVHSPPVSTNVQMRESHDPERTDVNTNTKMEDLSLSDSTSQSQPEADTQTGSDITPSSVSEHSVIRQRNKQ
uniref:Resistance to inhibitors of cholinesterase protein 3 N-terminal domain-containing protein n=1 Tax=Sinocyclocheilus grahami TaxID=75366 RepID=A0A672L339_SINGR